MAFIFGRPLKGRTPWGVFHNFGTGEETGYVDFHFFAAHLMLIWGRKL